MEHGSYRAKFEAVGRWCASIIIHIRDIKGKLRLVGGAGLVTFVVGYLVFSDVRVTTSARITDVREILVAIAHAPESFVGRLSILLIALFLFMSAIWANAFQKRNYDKINREEIVDLLRAPKSILGFISRQQALDYAYNSVRSSETYLNNIRNMIFELKNCEGIDSFSFHRKYDYPMCLHNAINGITQAAHVANIAISMNGIVIDQPKIPISDAGRGGVFRPESNEAFFEAMECNIAIIDRNIEFVKHEIPRLREKLSEEVTQILRD